jgi:hypothetical protein
LGSLGTDDLQVALRKMTTAKAEVDRIFAEAEAALKNPAGRDYKVREAIQRAVRAHTNAHGAVHRQGTRTFQR